MKYRKADRPPNERDKLRQFKDLDDAFAQALQALEEPGNALNIPTGPPVRSLAALEEEEHSAARECDFMRRVEALINDYQVSHAELIELIETLLEHGLWQDKPPA